jgi:polynucleotide 5'-triphosphatase
VPKPASNPTGPARNKDRISYAHQLFTIDLTQVTGGPQGGQNTTHELEIEFKDARVLLVEARKEAEGQDNRYMEMVQAFLNNVRKYRPTSRLVRQLELWC